MCFLGMLTATLSKIAYEIALLSRSEVGEVREPFVLGRGASSTMPQKRNPVGAEAVIAIGKLVREQVPVALDCMVVDGERSTGTWMAEWEIVPSSFILASAAMHHIAVLLEGLEIDTERMHRNLGITRGLIMAEAVMMALATEVGRQQAHDLVYEACRKAEQSGKELLDTVREDPVLSQFLPWEKLRGLLDPTRYTGRAAEFVETVVSTVKRERGDVSKW
jgi:3-carboxy-cis,cis-muconate cycloisomerase